MVCWMSQHETPKHWKIQGESADFEGQRDLPPVWYGNRWCLFSERKILVKVCRHLMDNFVGGAFHFSSVCQINRSEMVGMWTRGITFLMNWRASCILPMSSLMPQDSPWVWLSRMYSKRTGLWLSCRFITLWSALWVTMAVYLPHRCSTLLWSDSSKMGWRQISSMKWRMRSHWLFDQDLAWEQPPQSSWRCSTCQRVAGIFTKVFYEKSESVLWATEWGFLRVARINQEGAGQRTREHLDL